MFRTGTKGWIWDLSNTAITHFVAALNHAQAPQSARFQN